MLWALGYKGDPRDVWAANYWFSVSEYILLRISECVNPIFYNLGSNQMRRCTLKLLNKMIGRKHASTLDVESSATSGGLSTAVINTKISNFEVHSISQFHSSNTVI